MTTIVVGVDDSTRSEDAVALPATGRCAPCSSAASAAG